MLKGVKEVTSYVQETLNKTRRVADFSFKIMKARRQWENIFRCSKKHVVTENFVSDKLTSKLKKRHPQINKLRGSSLQLNFP